MHRVVTLGVDSQDRFHSERETLVGSLRAELNPDFFEAPTVAPHAKQKKEESKAEQKWWRRLLGAAVEWILFFSPAAQRPQKEGLKKRLRHGRASIAIGEAPNMPRLGRDAGARVCL
jgi:hypothetical protein